jgi:hypothetical protein
MKIKIKRNVKIDINQCCADCATTVSSSASISTIFSMFSAGSAGVSGRKNRYQPESLVGHPYKKKMSSFRPKIVLYVFRTFAIPSFRPENVRRKSRDLI